MSAHADSREPLPDELSDLPVSDPPVSDPPVVVVGVGAAGWQTLSEQAQHALTSAGAIVGGPRQLALLPEHLSAQRVEWGKPLRASIGPIVNEYAARGLAVLASGDPWHYGIARTLAEEIGLERIRVLPVASSMSLACAELGWPVEATQVVHVLGGNAAAIVRVAFPGQRVLVLVPRGSAVTQVAQALVGANLADSQVSVLGNLGAPNQSHVRARAAQWLSDPPVMPDSLPRLAIVAVRCARDATASGPGLSLVPGLPDAVFTSDGQLTKWEVRALTLAALAPRPGQLLWDVGAGTGTIAVEWSRAHPTCAAIAIEARGDRTATITANAHALGVPQLRVVTGQAPAVLAELPQPDVVFIGGGLTTPGLFDACWQALPPGGRLVANVVTLESEALLVSLQARYGGALSRLQVSRAEPIGSFTAWSTARPVTQWRVTKGGPSHQAAPRSATVTLA